MAYTTIDDPTAYFQTKTYTGTGSSLSQTFDGNTNMQPDFIWFKQRGGATAHALVDSVRGRSKVIFSNNSNAEETSAASTNDLVSFDSNGFTVGTTNVSGSFNTSSGTHVAWNWKAGGSASSNSNGSITSSVSANTTAGFSIVTVADIGTTNFTFGHGLGVAPSWVLAKSRDGGKWNNYFKALGANYTIQLDQTSAKISNSTMWQNTHPTNSVVYANGNQLDDNESYVFYCFAEKKGYSKFGSYEGNGNADGTFVYTGFKPAMVIMKKTSGADDWALFDNKRDVDNVTEHLIRPNTSAAEEVHANFKMDLLSNGFKLKTTDGKMNGSGASYIYMSFSENPFVTSTGIPTTAR